MWTWHVSIHIRHGVLHYSTAVGWAWYAVILLTALTLAVITTRLERR